MSKIALKLVDVQGTKITFEPAKISNELTDVLGLNKLALALGIKEDLSKPVIYVKKSIMRDIRKFALEVSGEKDE